MAGEFEAAGIAKAQQGIGQGGAVEGEGVGAARLQVYGEPVVVAGQLEGARQAAAHAEEGAGAGVAGEVVGDDLELAAAAIAAEVAGAVAGLHHQLIDLSGRERIAPGQRPSPHGVGAGGALHGADRHRHHGRLADVAAQQRRGVLGVEGGDAHQRRLGVDRELEGLGEAAAAVAVRFHHLGGVGDGAGAGGLLEREGPAGGFGGGGGSGAAHQQAVAVDVDALPGSEGLAEGAVELHQRGVGDGAAGQAAVYGVDREAGQGRTDEALQHQLVGGGHTGEGEILEPVPDLVHIGVAEGTGEEQGIAS